MYLYSPPPRQTARSIWIDPPRFRPPELEVPEPPPPLLVQVVPRRPFPDAVWIGGYWVWLDGWVWARAMWSAPPCLEARWVCPRYAAQDGQMRFRAGYWGSADAAEPHRTGLGRCVLPAPPGSSPGIVVPAPDATAPAVLTGIPPIHAEGMRVSPLAGPNGRTMVAVDAPATATIAGLAIHRIVPRAADEAAGMTALVRNMAPLPRSEVAMRFQGPSMKAVSRGSSGHAVF
ncbi:hypothetical protein [Roseateles sp.]|uniref:hypothetical protein n=1 Tax=Roseateles sp. TaxID=1971397 RepID=UPI0025D18954|nr:hypothetical protein [Roseateles sp.]MBV8036540.1 hypothetical protein [Roseateles sp.]